MTTNRDKEKLVINKAMYFSDKRHSNDITKIISTLAYNGQLDLIASNLIDGDPHLGVPKKLYINYSFGGTVYELTVNEGERIVLPESGISEPVTETIEQHKIVKPLNVSTFTDIIIPVYNNDTLTAKCVYSIREYTKKGTYRIILVDNNSDALPLTIKELAGSNHIYIHLLENKGFVGAINEGLRVSDAPTVCFLNNDTEVSSRWLEKLTATLYSDVKLGIVGSLTGPPAILERYDSHHNIAYQQKAREVPRFPHYINLEDFNAKIESQLEGMIGKVDFVAFLCAVIKREVIEKVTAFDESYKFGLDTNFKQGMWDDLDYARAVSKVGYTYGLSLDTCIIHHGRQTFNLIQKNEDFNVNELLKKNREYLDKKWNVLGKKAV